MRTVGEALDETLKAKKKVGLQDIKALVRQAEAKRADLSKLSEAGIERFRQITQFHWVRTYDDIKNLVSGQKGNWRTGGRLQFGTEEKYKAAFREARLLRRIDEQATKQAKRIEQLNAQVSKVEAAKAELNADVAALRDSLGVLAKDAKEARKALRKAINQAKKASKTGNISDRVDQIIRHLTNKETAPAGLLLEQVGQSNRTRLRQIHLSADETRRLQDMGALSRDLFHSLRSQYADLSGRLAIREVTSDPTAVARLKDARAAHAARMKKLDEAKDAAGKEAEKLDWKKQEEALKDAVGKEGLEKELRDLQDSYNEMISEALKKGDSKRATALRAERVEAEQDLKTMRDRLLGRNPMPGDPESWGTWAMHKIREVNFLRMAGGFMISSLTDIATGVLGGTFGKTSMKAYKKWRRLTQEAVKNGEGHEIIALARGAELAYAYSRTAQISATDDIVRKMGIGTPGTAKHTFTSQVDRVTGFLSEKMNMLNAQGPWTIAMKGMGSIVQLQNLKKMVDGYAKLSELDVGRLASLGVGEYEARTLKKYFDIYGKIDEDGFFEPQADLWGNNPADLEARRVLRMTIKAATDRIVPTPGVGDVPWMMMSSPVARMLLQFATFGFVGMNRFLTPAAQRIVHFQDMQAVNSIAMALGLGVLITGIKDAMRGEDPLEITPQRLIAEAIDRSGLLAFMGPYVDSAIKIAGPPINEMVGADIFEPSNRYQRNSALTSLLGPWFSTLQLTGDGLAAMSDGDMEKLRQKAVLLSPYSTFFRVGGVLSDKFGGGQ